MTAEALPVLLAYGQFAKREQINHTVTLGRGQQFGAGIKRFQVMFLKRQATTTEPLSEPFRSVGLQPWARDQGFDLKQIYGTGLNLMTAANAGRRFIGTGNVCRVQSGPAVKP